jgi:hypothetical protein
MCEIKSNGNDRYITCTILRYFTVEVTKDGIDRQFFMAEWTESVPYGKCVTYNVYRDSAVLHMENV